jgi:hypothetical protein
MLTAHYSRGRAAQVAAMGFSFPAPGDHIEVCVDGYRGKRFRAAQVYEYHGRTLVSFYDPCATPGCHECDYTSVPVTAVRPFVSG